MTASVAIQRVPLGEVAVIDRTAVSADDIATGTLFVGLEHISSDGGIQNVARVTAGEIGSTKFCFDHRHVLYGKLRPYLRKIARPTFSGVCSTDILPLLPGRHVDRGYLYHFLRQDEMIELANSRTTGANLPRLSPAVLESFEVPLPPLPEQRRIAAILDQADALSSKRQQAFARLKALTQSVFLEMFGDPIGNPYAWPTAQLGDLGTWASGGTPPRSKNRYFEGQVPWFSSGELGPTFVMDSREKLSGCALAETSAKRVPKGALMLGMYDTAALKASIAGVDCSCNQAVAFAQLRRSIEPLIAYYMIVVGRDHFRRQQRGVRQKNLNLSLVKAIRIPVPPVATQRRFLDHFSNIAAVQRSIRRSADVISQLFASLEFRAFSGDI